MSRCRVRHMAGVSRTTSRQHVPMHGRCTPVLHKTEEATSLHSHLAVTYRTLTERGRLLLPVIGSRSSGPLTAVRPAAPARCSGGGADRMVRTGRHRAGVARGPEAVLRPLDQTRGIGRPSLGSPRGGGLERRRPAHGGAPGCAAPFCGVVLGSSISDVISSRSLI
jgi:hypothetical protein